VTKVKVYSVFTGFIKYGFIFFQVGMSMSAWWQCSGAVQGLDEKCRRGTLVRCRAARVRSVVVCGLGVRVEVQRLSGVV